MRSELHRAISQWSRVVPELFTCGELHDDRYDESLLTAILLPTMEQIGLLQGTEEPAPVRLPRRRRLFPRHRRLASRLIIYRLPPAPMGELGFVGFIGKKRAGLSAEVVERINKLDLALVHELVRFPELVSYASLQLSDGNWGNLVLFTQPSLLEGLRTSQRHRYAAFDLAPSYYEWVRLHQGTVFCAGPLPVLMRETTRYYVFDEALPRPLLHVSYSRQARQGPDVKVGKGSGQDLAGKRDLEEASA
ncbi:hypothetical protein [Thermogemmatispora sp.]|uniref:hypothetical protein n=1 Tax=Thermogemmatispora sp. TaxID=1968838 RepID=UPI0035E46081